MDMRIFRASNWGALSEADKQALKKEGINTYNQNMNIYGGSREYPVSYIRDFKYGMIEKLFNLFGALIIDKDGITIYDDYVE